MLQMKAIGLRGENLWQIVDTGAKVKNAILQMSEEDHFLYQVDVGSLNPSTHSSLIFRVV